MKAREIKFIARGFRWFDKINGNTYHSVRVIRLRDNKVIFAPYQYGYGDSYQDTALALMAENKWIPPRYRVRHENGSYNHRSYERENNYPIEWHITDGLKRDCIANGTK